MLIVRVPILPYSPFACVYRINFGLGRFYIGSTTDLDSRADSHASSIKRGSREVGEYIAIISGKYSIRFEILEEVTDLSTLVEREQYYLSLNVGNENCMNVRTIASQNGKVKRLLESV